MAKKGSYSTPAAFLMALKRQVQARSAETGRPYNRELQLERAARPAQQPGAGPPGSRAAGLPPQFEGAQLREAIETTFAFRGTHAVPNSVPEAPERWRGQYRRLAEENDLRWTDLDEVLEVARSFLDPVLVGSDGRWSPTSWRWSER